MSLKIITNLFNFIKVKLDVDEETIIIKTIEIENECSYTIELKIKDELYSIRHFEPLKIIQGVDYGMGHWYDICLFNKEKNHYENIKL